MTSSQRMLELTGFLSSYRRAFESFDAQGLADHCCFPLQVAQEGTEVALLTIGSHTDYVRMLDDLQRRYRTIGVTDGLVLGLKISWLSDRLLMASVEWEVQGTGGKVLYEFHACYTIAQTRRGWRICAIAHNELPRLEARMRMWAV